MIRRGTRAFAWLLVSGWAPACFAHSLCVQRITECQVVDGRVQFAVVLGAGTELIAGAQLALTYPSSDLEFLSALPGQACDSDSVFQHLVTSDVDRFNGKIFMAVTVDSSSTATSTAGPDTLACLAFQVKSAATSEVCLTGGVGTSVTILADEFGSMVPVNNSVDCPGAMENQLSCDAAPVSTSCACGSQGPDCGNFDGECSLGICDEPSARCVPMAIHPGDACDDGQTCTQGDYCRDGVCVGRTVTCPSLCVEACEESEEDLTARIVVQPRGAPIAAAQFSLTYNPLEFTFVDIRPGSRCDSASPFTSGVGSVIQQANDIFYSVSVNPFDLETAATGRATVACARFKIKTLRREHICIFSGTNPFLAQLSDPQGNEVEIFNGSDCPVAAPWPILACGISCDPVPAASEWGLVVVTLLLLAGGKVAFGFRGN